LDQMAGIGGVGVKKLDSFGEIFLQVISGEAVDELHPSRKKLAGRSEGALFDRLLEAQAELARGIGGTDKQMSCSASLLARVASVKPSDLGSLTRLLGERRAERFGRAFLQVLKDS